MSMIVVYAIVLVLLVLVAGTFQYWAVVARRERLGSRLSGGEGEQAPAEQTEKRLRRSSYFETLFGAFLTEQDLPLFLRRPGLEAVRAGLRMGVFDMLLLMTFAGVLLGAMVYLKLGRWEFAAGAAVIGALLPYLFVKIKANARVAQLELQLADTLDMVIGALGSGIGLRQALEVARTNVRAPMKDVLTDILVRSDLGVPFHSAFREEADTLRSKYFELIALAVTANTQAGAALTPMLQGLVFRIREAVRFRRRVRSLTAEARFSSVFLFLMPWILIVLIYHFSPAWWSDNIVPMWTDPVGRPLIYGAVSAYVLGIVIILKMLRIQE